MAPTSRPTAIARLVLMASTVLACADAPTTVTSPLTAQYSEAKSPKVTASTRWNRRVGGLLAQRPPANGQAAASRILTYLSLAQYRAVLAADAAKNGSTHPSVSAAVGGASVAVLAKFFPLDAAALEAQLDADRIADQSSATKPQNFAAGEAIGRSVGDAVNTQAAADNYLVVPTGTPPAGPGYWTPSSAAIVRSLHGAKPFFMTSASQLRAPPPPAFGSPEFLAALAEVRKLSDTRTPEQLALAQLWNTSVPPFTAGALNLIADDLIEAQNRSERDAAAILAYANAAAFDAQIACFDSKFTYWFIRPSQADAGITLPIGLPNHPAYPSAHSCITGAIMAVLVHVAPNEQHRLNGIVDAAGLSRIYGGLHYGFDVVAGQNIGRGAAALALKGSLR